MKELLFVLILIISVFSVNASVEIMNEQEVNESMALFESMNFASLHPYNDYTVPKFNGEVNLLQYLGYDASIRDQGHCGSCWVWGGTLITELALSIEVGIKDRLSIQYTDSTLREGNYEPCNGGYWGVFKQVVDYLDKFVPWTDYTDYNYSSANRYDIPISEIDDSIYYPVKIDYELFEIEDMSSSEIENMLKDYLDHGKVISFSFYFPESNDWSKFYDFWYNKIEDDVVNLDVMVDNLTWSDGGGHFVNIVGYNEIDRYWIVQNSWGSTEKRPNGIFKMTMDMDYNAKRNWYGELIYRYKFFVYNYEFGNENGLRIEPEDDSMVNIDKVIFDKKNVSAGDVITTSTKVSNDYEYMNLHNVRVTYFIPKLGLKRSVGPFDIDMFEDVMKRVYVDIPSNAKSGVYDVRIVLQTEDTKEVRYEEIVVE